MASNFIITYDKRMNRFYDRYSNYPVDGKHIDDFSKMLLVASQIYESSLVAIDKLYNWLWFILHIWVVLYSIGTVSVSTTSIFIFFYTRTSFFVYLSLSLIFTLFCALFLCYTFSILSKDLSKERDAAKKNLKQLIALDTIKFLSDGINLIVKDRHDCNTNNLLDLVIVVVYSKKTQSLSEKLNQQLYYSDIIFLISQKN